MHLLGRADLKRSDMFECLDRGPRRRKERHRVLAFIHVRVDHAVERRERSPQDSYLQSAGTSLKSLSRNSPSRAGSKVVGRTT